VSSDPWVEFGRLRRIGDVNGLVDLLADPRLRNRRRLRGYVLTALSRASNRAATSALIDAYDEDPSPDNRLLAAAFLAGRSDPGVEAALLRALHDPNKKIRIHAARGLASIGSPAAATALSDALRDASSSVRWEAADSLSKVGPAQPEVIQALVDALDDRSVKVRLSASRALSSLGAVSALPAMRDARDRAWPPVRQLLTRHIRALEEQFLT
jgi:HEAT repeat protein